jgi:fatty-acyl-CoA synthase
MNDFLSLLYGHFRERPAKPFCHLVGQTGETTASYGEIESRAAHYLAFFAGADVRRGDVVLIFLANSLDLYASYIGAMWMGAIPSFMPLPSAKQQAARYWAAHIALLDRIKPAAILTDRLNAKDMRANGLTREGMAILATEDVAGPTGARLDPALAAPSDIALLQHSSGTTGLKKGVALSHGAIAAQIDSYAPVITNGRDNDVIATWLPLYHDMGLITSTLIPLALGLTIVALDPFRWVANPQSLFAAIERRRATLVWLPNFGFEHLRRTVDPGRRHYDLTSIRAFINCSEPCKPETFDRFVAAFAPFGIRPQQLQTCYAMAETVFAISQTPIGAVAKTVRASEDALAAGGFKPAEAKPGGGGRRLQSCGPIIPNLAVRIVDDNGMDLADGRIGEVVVSGTSLFDGYFRLPEQTSERLRDGWYFTRDLGFLHEGEIYVLGRKDDLIIINGRNYLAHDIEFSLQRVIGLKAGRTVAFGIFNRELGSDEMIVVAEQDPATERSVDALRRDIKLEVLQIANLTIREAVVVPPGWLVKTSSGKISREANKEKYLQLSVRAR